MMLDGTSYSRRLLPGLRRGDTDTEEECRQLAMNEQGWAAICPDDLERTYWVHAPPEVLKLRAAVVAEMAKVKLKQPPRAVGFGKAR